MCLLEWTRQNATGSCKVWFAAELCDLLHITKEKGCVKCKSFNIRVTNLSLI